MRRDGFEIEISQISKTKGFIFFGVLLLILIINITVIFSKDKKSVSYAYHDDSIGLVENNPVISIFKIDENIVARKNEVQISDEIIGSYKCNTNKCYVYDLNKDANEIILYDNDIFIYNYLNNTQNILNIDYNEALDIKYLNNIIYVKNKNKYALYDITNNNYLTDFIYDGVSVNKYTNIVNSLYSLYTNNSKYNQTLDIYDTNNTVIKHLDYCVGYTNINTGQCSEHVKSLNTSEDVDKLLDIIVNNYKDLNNDRLFLIKTALETVELPYGNINARAIDNLVNIATQTWNTDGLDNNQFIRWLYYVCVGVDALKEERSISDPKNPNFKPVNEENLLPGDLIRNGDQVGLFLYKDEEGKHIVIHESSINNKVEITNYDNNNAYYRLGVWR